MLKRVLVPLDGSAFAEAALPLALSLAKKSGAELRLSMVNEPANLPPGLWAEAFLSNHAQYIESATASVGAKAGPGTMVSSVLLEGEVARAICDEAEDGADLVVMSTHGHGRLTRVWLGSVADAVVRESPVPVLLVRPEEREDEAPVAAEKYSHVLVALDGTPFAEAAIGPAVEMAKLFGTPLTLLRAVSYPIMASSYLPDTAADNEAFLQEAELSARAYLDEVTKRLGTPSGDLSLDVLVSGRPAEAIMDHVAEVGADLVVMASHTRHGLARVVLGSITDKVIRGSTTPVMVVHPPTKEPSSSEEIA